MRKTLFAVLISFLSGIAVPAQTGFRPGFVIKNNGDTLNGLVEYTTDAKFGKSCTFKRFDIAQIISYRPDQIKAYGFDHGRYFESKRKGRKLAFMECLVKGKTSVYIDPGKDKSTVYLEEASSGFYQLKRGNNQFAGVDYDARDIAEKVKTSALESVEPSQSFAQTPEVTLFKDFSVTNTKSTQIGIAAGYQFLTVGIPGTVFSKYFTDAEYNASFRPSIGIFLNKRLLKNSNLLSLDLAVLYLKDTYYGYSTYEYLDAIYNNDILIDLSSVQVPLSLKFRFGKGKIHPFFKAGIYTSLDMDASFIRYEDRLEGGTEVYSDRYSEYNPGPERGLQGSLGLEWHIGSARILSLEAGYQRGKSELYSSIPRYNTVIHTNCLSFQFRINL
ncbi:MAG: outer membrane beta-barrel protein [Bacteroidales bacterium]|nr:outer membrane beta-barrel protein [Bacteroidales bacterium]